jgi:hypothetical protein
LALSKAKTAKKDDIHHKNSSKNTFPCSIVFMEPEILCVPSAYKHGYTQDDIKRAFRTKIYEGLLRGEDDTNVIIGFDTVANPIEVFYNIIDDETIRVFHAMALRDKTAALMD